MSFCPKALLTTNEVGTVPALVSIACLTNPRVRFGRSLDELNIWAPFLLYSRRYPGLKRGKATPRPSFKEIITARAVCSPLAATGYRGTNNRTARTFLREGRRRLRR